MDAPLFKGRRCFRLEIQERLLHNICNINFACLTLKTDELAFPMEERELHIASY